MTFLKGVLPFPEQDALSFLPTQLVLFAFSTPDQSWELYFKPDATRGHEEALLGIFLVAYKARGKSLLFLCVLMSTILRCS